MAIHIGKKIKDELYKQRVSITAFAEKINRSRNVIYDIFERESIDTALLNKIGLVLRVDFFSLYSDQKEYKKEGIVTAVVREDQANYTTIQDQLKAQEKRNAAYQDEIIHLKKLIAIMEADKKKKGKKAKGL